MRAVAVSTPEDAERTRQHNDANVLCLSGWNQDAERVAPIIARFLDTAFTGEERHVRRLTEIEEYESR